MPSDNLEPHTSTGIGHDYHLELLEEGNLTLLSDHSLHVIFARSYQ